MSESEQDAPRRWRRFSEEFKRDAVRLVVEEGYAFKAAATAVGVSDQTLRAWHAKLVPPPEPCGEHATLQELHAENQRLRRELRRAEGCRGLAGSPFFSKDCFQVRSRLAWTPSLRPASDRLKPCCVTSRTAACLNSAGYVRRELLIHFPPLQRVDTLF